MSVFGAELFFRRRKTLPFMFYPMLLLLSSVIFIIADRADKKENLDKTADL